MKKALISGITGQDGSYLAELLLSKGYDTFGIQRRTSTITSERIDHIFEADNNKTFYADLADTNSLINVLLKVKPDEIYNLGSQSHVRISFEIPEYTAQVTGVGALRWLEALRSLGMTNVKYYQASSSEMFGISPPPQNENTPMLPQSPYGVSKLFAYHMTKVYRVGYGMFACNGILFNHECLTAQTPIIVKINPNDHMKSHIIQIKAIEELVPHREDPLKGKKYTTECSGNLLEIWDDGKWSKVKTKTATWNTFGNDSDKNVKSVNCRGGYYEATACHKSFLQDKIETPTYLLKRGDKLHLSEYPDLTETMVVSKEESELLGMLTADGYIGANCCRFAKTSLELRERIKLLWIQVTGGFTTDTSHPSGYNDSFVPCVELNGATNYHKMIEQELYNEKRFKQIPTRILNSKRESIIAYLRGYNNCDGLKGGKCTCEFKSFTTNSQVLAAGLWYLVDKALGLRVTSHPEYRNGLQYYHLNINSPVINGSGKHLVRDITEVKGLEGRDYTGWLFDLETDSGTFSAGIGKTWVHNSERRGMNFVTQKIVYAAVNIKMGNQNKVRLGNLDAKRDWGFAGDFCEGIYKIMQHTVPDDFVLATSEQYSVREFAENVFNQLGLNFNDHVEYDQSFTRPNEVPSLMGDSTKARTVLGWKPEVSFEGLVDRMIKGAWDNVRNNTQRLAFSEGWKYSRYTQR